MENKASSQIVGSSGAPYINALAGKCGNATNFFGITHPSLPNYIAMTSGGTQGITDDSGPSSHRLAVPSIFSQAGEAVNDRALNIDRYQGFEESVIDMYSAVRDAYLRRREQRIRE